MSATGDSRDLRSRVQALEVELADARAELAKLRGSGSVARDEMHGKHDRIIGREMTLALSQTTPGVPDAQAVEAIARRLLATRPNAQVSQVGRVLHAKDGPVTMTVRPGQGETTVEASGDWAASLGGFSLVMITIGCGLGIGLPMFGLFVDVLSAPTLGALWIPLSVLLGAFGFRAHARDRLKQEKAALRALVAESARVVSSGPRERIVDEVAEPVPARVATPSARERG